MQARQPQPDLTSGLAAGEIAGEVLDIVSGLADELHPHRRGLAPLSFESDLDQGFGLDSLGRVEAIQRLEAAFNVRLADTLFAQAATPADLARAIAKAGPVAVGAAHARVQASAASGAQAAPGEAGTIIDILAWHAQHQPERPHIYLSDGDREEPPITYGALVARAGKVAAGLSAMGIEPGARIGLMLPTGGDFFAAFLGVLGAGGVPAPIYPPWRMSQIEEHLRRQARILAAAEVAGLIAFPEAAPFARLLEAHVPSLGFVATVPEIEAHPGPPRLLHGSPDDLALLQFTSGSTADPKGVMLTNANIIANARGISRAIRATPADVTVSWLPLYHDMGLIAAWLSCLDQAAPFVVMNPLSFMARPERWLWTLHRNRATITAAPNFAFEICLAIPDARLTGLDLSALRVAGCGSEPIAERTVEDFTRRYAVYGFRPEAFLPVYGLAECAAALTMCPPGRTPRIDHVNARALAITGEAEPCASDAPGAQAIVSCGAPLTGHELRILDVDGREAPERREGRLQFRGPSATKGYFNAPEKTAELVLPDGWLESGDLAYLAGGELYVTGRTKDIVKRAGRNIHPVDVESAIEALPDVAANGAALFSVLDPERGAERLVLAIETPATEPSRRAALISHAQEAATERLESAVDDIVLMPPGAFPRTESGKVRRPALRQRYLAGAASGSPVSAKRQLLRLEATAALGRVRRAMRRLGERLYALYWWTIVGLIGAVLWPLVMTLPRLHWRWAVAHRLCRIGLPLLAHQVTVTGERPELCKDVVYVANHESYMDNVVLCALLPGDLAFAAYGELAQNWFQGSFVRRLGAIFVERFDPTGAVADATRALELLRAGRPLVIFPEATIMPMPGLLDFRMGAFVTAAKAGAPVVPIAIRGDRHILRHDGRWFPRRGNVEVHIGHALTPAGSDFEAALALKNAARADILAHVNEPDIAAETPRY
ncbi:MAG TPA: AMP-binding protein [Caulobacteraceae bacterium]|nr:AMP-binding protein [Caulobacteraceae bacterium]